MQYHTKRPARILVLVVLTTAVFGCEYVRLVTYPPEFTYLTKDNVETSMAQMAAHVSRLEELLNPTVPGDSDQQAAVVAELGNLEKVVRSLGAGASPTNHLYIDANIDEFATSLRRARSRAEQSPPDYYLIGQITGNCAACHVRR